MPSLSEVLISSFVPRGTTSIYFIHTFLVPRGTTSIYLTHTFLVPRGTKGGGRYLSSVPSTVPRGTNERIAIKIAFRSLGLMPGICFASPKVLGRC